MVTVWFIGIASEQDHQSLLPLYNTTCIIFSGSIVATSSQKITTGYDAEIKQLWGAYPLDTWTSQLPASVSQEILQKREQKDCKKESTRKSVVKQSLQEIAAQTRPDPMTNSKGENPMGGGSLTFRQRATGNL